MSSFLAKLEIDNKTYTILSCKYRFRQNLDSAGKPQANIRGGEIFLTIESDGKSTFTEWGLSTSKTKDGKIIFYRRDAMSTLKEIDFEKGYCIDFSEEFDAQNNQPMKIYMVIVAKNLKINNVFFSNQWKL